MAEITSVVNTDASSQRRPLKRRRSTSPTDEAHEDFDAHPIDFWAKNGTWPRRYFDDDNRSDRLTGQCLIGIPLRHPTHSGYSTACSTSKSHTPSNRRPRDEKIGPFRRIYPNFNRLQQERVYMHDAQGGITTQSARLCDELSQSNHTPPQGTIFDVDKIDRACMNLGLRNDEKIIASISQLIVPSADILSYFDPKLQILGESVNEAWDRSIPILKRPPQPDYAVGFRREAFSKDQLDKLTPWIGETFQEEIRSLLMGTWYLYFPFLSCEVINGSDPMDIPDIQNAHTAALAVRGVVELFRQVKRESEVDRQILAFSVSHNHKQVWIHGHYAVIDGKETEYHRHLIHSLNLTAFKGRERWTAYQFTRNVYESWARSTSSGSARRLTSCPWQTSLTLDVAMKGWMP